MSIRSIHHDTFSMERHYNVPVARAYVAWSDSAMKAKWFPKWEEFDFRIGGREVVSGAPPEGPIYTSVATYQDIVPESRIVYTLTLDMGETRISVSVITVEFESEESGTRLVYTEQCAFFDGLDSIEDHMMGANDFLDKLRAELNPAK